MEWMVVALAIIVCGSIIVAKVVERIIFHTFRLTREETFRKTLRGCCWSECEIDRAVEEQGWS